MLLPSAVTVFYVGFLVTAIYGKVGIHGRRAVDIYDPIILCDSIRTFYSYKDITCPYESLPTVTNGFFNNSSCSGNIYGDICNVTCIQNYYTTNSSTVCQLGPVPGEISGIWSGDTFICKKSECLAVDLPGVLHGSFQWCRDAMPSYDIGTVCNITCDYGYFAADLTEIQCELNSFNIGSWSSVVRVICEAIKCEDTTLPSVVNGYFDGSRCGDLVGDSCRMICTDGHYPETESVTECELLEGETFAVWSDDIPYSCKEPKCLEVDLPAILNGSYSMCPNAISSYSVGTTCTPSCDNGYFSTNLEQVECQLNSDNTTSWSTSDNMTCEAITCEIGSLPSVVNGYFDGPSCNYHVGDSCHMTCNNGYYPVTDSQTQCQVVEGETFGVWSDEISYSCQEITCDIASLPSVVNGYFDGSSCNDHVGSSCYMTCNSGYYPVTDAETQCHVVDGENFGVWSEEISYSCQEPKCLEVDLPNILNGSYSMCPDTTSSYNVGTICTPSCDYGYFSTNLEQVECQLNSDNTTSWSTSITMTCEAITCDDSTLPSVTNGHFDESSCTDRVGDSCHMTCDAGHYPVTDSETQCEQVVGENFGSWSADISYACEEPKCLFLDLPGILQGSYASCTNSISSYSVGTICNPSCNSGYYSTGLVQVECQLNADNTASWSTSASMTCEVITCDASTLPSVTNGYFDGSSCTDHVGDTCHMTCDAGHYPVTDSETQCEQVEGENFGSWSAVISYMCEEPKCLFLDLPGVLQGSYASCPNSISSYIVGTICNPACNSGYYSTSLTQVECQLNADNTASWSTSASMTCEVAYLDCKEIYDAGNSANGIYTIVPSSGSSFQVYCKMDNGGGWTVFQRRTDATVSFVQDWETYKNGFGDLNGNFWLGNDKLYHFTNQKTYELRIDVQKSNGGAEHATYPEFQIESESMKYRLNKLGDHSSGNAGEYFYRNKGKYFSTYDMDNDQCAMFNCAEKHKSGWWHSNEDCDYCWGDYCSCFQQGSCCYTCSYENLNGEYNGASGQNMYTSDTDYCNLMYVEMKLRPS